VVNLWQNFKLGATTSSSSPCIGQRAPGSTGEGGKPGKAGPFEFKSYSEIKTAAESFGAGLRHLDLAPVAQEANGFKLRNLAM
jgi:hypothetical protein